MQRVFRQVGYLYGGTGGRNVRDLINPWAPKELRLKEEYFIYRQSYYKPRKIIEFDQYGSLLIYKYQHSMFRTISSALTKIIPTYISWYLLVNNPYPFSLEPLALPVFLVYGLTGLWRSFKQFANNSLSVYEIRLRNDGIHIEMSYLDWLGREKMKSRYTADIKDLKPPPLYPDSFPLKGDLFPHLVEGFEINSETPHLPWVKYHEVIRKRFFIYKDYTYMDRELMTAVMNGFYIQLHDRPET